MFEDIDDAALFRLDMDALQETSIGKVLMVPVLYSLRPPCPIYRCPRVLFVKSLVPFFIVAPVSYLLRPLCPIFR